MSKFRRPALVTSGVAVSLILAACGSQGMQQSGGTQAPPPPPPAPSPAMSQGTTTAQDVFGPGCSKVPTDPSNQGSVQGMIDDPVGTAASNNPLLTKLTAAVKAAGLVDTLNKSDAQYTVFAPADPAFDAIPKNQLQAMLTDPAQKEKLTSTLTYHVVPQRMTADDLAKAGTVNTVQGGQVKTEGSGDQLKVNGANVLCGNVPTANATVFVIDQVTHATEVIPVRCGGAHRTSTAGQGVDRSIVDSDRRGAATDAICRYYGIYTQEQDQ